jgi:glycerophosphoryl diester phosphodiesterase
MEKEAYPRVFAHRGVAQAAPENTMGAFEAAAALGLGGIELDVRLTRDGIPVVFHDENLTRLTIGLPEAHSNARIAETDWETLERVRLPYANHLLPETLPDFAADEFLASSPPYLLGQAWGRDYLRAAQKDPRQAKILTLRAYLDWFAGQTAVAETEIELCAPGTVKAVFSLLDGHPATARCIVFTGHPLVSMELQKTVALRGKPGGLRLGLNIRRLDEDTKEDIADMDLFEVGLNPGHFTREDLAWLAEKGIAALANLEDTRAWWHELPQLPLYGFKTNYAAAFLASR